MGMATVSSFARTWRAWFMALALLAAGMAPAAAQRESAPWLDRLYAPGQPPLLWHHNQYEQARQALALLRSASAHGLDPSRYGVDALSRQLETLDPADAERFDQALSKAMLQLLADLHFGRVTPEVTMAQGEARLPAFDPVEHLRVALRERSLDTAVDAAAPNNPLYKRVQASLAQYRGLAAAAPPWSAPAKLPAGGKLAIGRSYPGLDRVRQRLVLLGDLDADDADDSAPEADLHTEALAEAIKRFQARHGLAETGALGRDTLAAFATPLGERVHQLVLTLERLRWIPTFRPGRVIIVNVAAFRLWAFDTATGSAPLGMRVIVGKAARTPTPLFIGQMRYLEFNPYWNVPRSIALGEIIPKLARNPAYLAQNGMEMVSAKGQVVSPSLAGLRAGTLRVRQRPGSHNVLGAVKFAMPNPMNIYLHSTSAKDLFGKARRDLSHGCIRVEQPAELARFVLADEAQWNAQAIEQAMQPGPMRTVRLPETIPVVLFYATAGSDRNGRAVFASDIYQRDAKLMRALGMM